MAIIPVRVKLDENAYTYFDDHQFLQKFLLEFDNAGSNAGISYELRSHIKNTISLQGSELNLVVRTLGRMMRQFVRDLRVGTDEHATLESADIEVLMRIFETVGEEIERRGDATPKV